MRLRVVARDGAILPPGKVGELCLKGPGLMAGYFGDEKATQEALRDGWLHTGDLGRMDSTGYVFFEGRKKDVIKVKGENVSAGEVERVVNGIPSIEDCSAIGVPDPVLGERLVMFVVLVKGNRFDEWEILSACREQLAPFKVPSEVRVLSDLPRTAIGKVRKGELRDMAAHSLKP
jgi:acyl-CoA synthetase (AMP-forming)/AMP-acid ligase II